jgi:hypothetical protein
MALEPKQAGRSQRVSRLGLLSTRVELTITRFDLGEASAFGVSLPEAQAEATPTRERLEFNIDRHSDDESSATIFDYLAAIACW